jgi:hypothetical protein
VLLGGAMSDGYNSRMRTGFRIVALLIALGVLAFWCFGGPNLGWTKTSVAHKKVDPVTELEVNVYEKQFVPGVDFLGAGLACSAVIASLSFFFRKSAKTQN